MNTLNVLVLGAVGDQPLEEIAAFDPTLHVIDGRGVFEVEYAHTWPAETVHRYVPRTLIVHGTTTRAERDTLLASADIICPRFPFPLDLRARCPRLK